MGHVGFVVGSQQDKILLLGGNQRNAVTIEAFDTARLLGLRWPHGEAAGSPAGGADEIFETALKHVLEMEGGYTEDPFDPGGPTNLGITLAVYAAHKGVELAPTTSAALERELKALPVAVAREIYLRRYWAPSKAPLLPAAVALMHFDAAVNHGVGNAARMLQQAARVTVDGDIGPETLQAVRSASAASLVRRYADIRRARYRSLGHFWRFGRGWLARVDRTLAAAERLASLPPGNVQPPTSNGETSMTDTPAPQPATKWWGRSMTIWGAVVTALSTVLPVMGPLIGIDISADLVQQLGDEVTRVVQAAGGLIGIIMTIYGRSRASAPLERRPVTVQL
jgi:lysozyme family protein